jgi:hydroxyethylthiazole kinase
MSASPAPSGSGPDRPPCPVWSDVLEIRRRSPLVLNITNFVVMNITANALLALGASPVMAHATEELDEMIDLAQALVINIGTLSRDWIEAMERAVIAAGRRGIPVVIDPVGSGATRFRTDTARRLLALAAPAVLRANASEVRALAHAAGGTRGVDAVHASTEAIDSASRLCREFGCTVSISGSTDFIIDSTSRYEIRNGSYLMPKVTGLGCTASALTAAFCAVNRSPGRAAAHAMALMGVAGELATGKSAGPGTFVPHFLDTLYALDEGTLAPRLQMRTDPQTIA